MSLVEFDSAASNIFYNFETENEFFAEIAAYRFTDFLPLESLDFHPSEYRPGGYYVIFVGERHSVFENGVCIYCNTKFTGDENSLFRGRYNAYSIYLAGNFKAKDFDRLNDAEKNEYYEFHGVWSQNQHKMYALDKAITAAKKLSVKLNCRTAVVRLVEDYDMR
jgi:hypothetical protein